MKFEARKTDNENNKRIFAVPSHEHGRFIVENVPQFGMIVSSEVEVIGLSEEVIQGISNADRVRESLILEGDESLRGIRKFRDCKAIVCIDVPGRSGALKLEIDEVLETIPALSFLDCAFADEANHPRMLTSSIE